MDETKSPSETEATQPPAKGSGASTLDDPSKIGRYRVIRRIAQGGFGRVYLAHDDDLKRPVAIKVPNSERIARPEDVETYLYEARILANLDHPHIVPVYDLGRTDDAARRRWSPCACRAAFATRTGGDCSTDPGREWPGSGPGER